MSAGGIPADEYKNLVLLFPIRNFLFAFDAMARGNGENKAMPYKVTSGTYDRLRGAIAGLLHAVKECEIEVNPLDLSAARAKRDERFQELLSKTCREAVAESEKASTVVRRRGKRRVA